MHRKQLRTGLAAAHAVLTIGLLVYAIRTAFAPAASLPAAVTTAASPCDGSMLLSVVESESPAMFNSETDPQLWICEAAGRCERLWMLGETLTDVSVQTWSPVVYSALIDDSRFWRQPPPAGVPQNVVGLQHLRHKTAVEILDTKLRASGQSALADWFLSTI